MSNLPAVISIQEITTMGTAIAKSQLFGMKTPEQAVALMLVAQAQGRHPATVAMEYDIIQGRPALKSQVALMRFQEAGGKIEYIKRTDQEVSARFSHPQGGTLEVSWDIDRAKRMGYFGCVTMKDGTKLEFFDKNGNRINEVKDNWKKQPMIMMQWRVVAEGVRACYPACLGGYYLDTEVQDFEPAKQSPRDVTPTQEKDKPIEQDNTKDPIAGTVLGSSVQKGNVARQPINVTEAGVTGEEVTDSPTPDQTGNADGVVERYNDRGEAIHSILSGIDKVTYKEGTDKLGKPYKLFTIHAGERYTTFSETLATTARDLSNNGLIAMIEYTQNGKFRNLHSISESKEQF